MELAELKEKLLSYIKDISTTEIDVNGIKESSSEEELLLKVIGGLDMWFKTTYLTPSIIKELFDNELLDKNYILIGGNHTIYGSKTVVALEDATVKMMNNSTVHAFQNCVIYAFTLSNVFAHDDVKVYAKDESKITSYDNARVSASFKSSVHAYGNSVVNAVESSSVCAYDNSNVCANDYAFVNAFGLSNVTADGDCSVELHNRTCGKVKLRTDCKCFDNSYVTTMDESKCCAYDYSMVNAMDKSEVVSHNYSTVFCNNETNVTSLDNSIVHCFHAAKVKVCGHSYLNDYTDTHCNVIQEGIIRWNNSRNVFSPLIEK